MTDIIFNEQTIELLAQMLFLPEEFFESVEGRKGITPLRQAQIGDILRLIAENIAEADDLTPAERGKFMAVLQNLKPRKVVVAPIFED